MHISDRDIRAVVHWAILNDWVEQVEGERLEPVVGRKGESDSGEVDIDWFRSAEPKGE